MPNKTNLRRWVSALRSGQYQQGQGFMRKNGKYCCLGVAMDLAIANGVVCEPNWGSTSTIPDSVNAWFGIKGSGLNKKLFGDAAFYSSSPSYLNDHGTSFNEIANAIEHNYHLLED